MPRPSLWGVAVRAHQRRRHGLRPSGSLRPPSAPPARPRRGLRRRTGSRTVRRAGHPRLRSLLRIGSRIVAPRPRSTPVPAQRQPSAGYGHVPSAPGGCHSRFADPLLVLSVGSDELFVYDFRWWHLFVLPIMPCGRAVFPASAATADDFRQLLDELRESIRPRQLCHDLQVDDRQARSAKVRYERRSFRVLRDVRWI